MSGGGVEEVMDSLCKGGVVVGFESSIEAGRGARLGVRVGSGVAPVDTLRVEKGVRNGYSSNCWMKYVRKARALRLKRNVDSAG